jgi:DNA-binding CsgD family transcriptional regulator
MNKIPIASGFSKREIQVLVLLCLDFTQEEAADLLFISFETVRSHLRNMRERHNVKKASRLFLIAVATGYIKLKPQPQALNNLITSICLN